VQAFELTGVTTARTRLQAQAARGLSNFVGRQNEIDLFRRLTVEAGSETGPLHSPGQLESHYAPILPLRLNADSVAPGEALLAFGAKPPAAALSRNLSAGGDLEEAAANLFAMLRELDRPDLTRIAVMPIPETGLGVAINDRLRRAAAPR